MALLDEDEVNLIDFILSSQAATPSSRFNLENENICEEMYRQMSSKIENCKFLDNFLTCVPEVESSRTHCEVFGLGFEASSPRKLACPRFEDSTIF